MHTVRGSITAVQEQRFRLRIDAGCQLLLTLAHGVPITIEDLRRLHDANARVIVHYEGEANKESAAVHAIQWAASSNTPEPAGAKE